MLISENVIAWITSVDNVCVYLCAAGRLTVGNKGAIAALSFTTQILPENELENM